MAHDPSYNAPIYEQQGGARIVVGVHNSVPGVIEIASGGDINVDSGGTVTLASGGDLYVESGGTVTLASGAIATVGNGSSVIVQSGGVIETHLSSDGDAIGAGTVLHRIDIADGAGDTTFIITNKTRIIDVWAIKTTTAGGAGDTVTVKNETDAVTDAISLNVADKAIARAGTIDDAYHDVAASGTIRVTAANNTDNECTVYILGVRVA